MRSKLDFLRRQVRARPLAALTASFLLGLLAAQGHPLPAMLCAGLFALACGSAVALRHRRALAALLLLTGFMAGMTRMTLTQDAIPTVKTRYSVEMVGRVASEPFNNPNTGRLISHFQLESVDGEPSDLRLRLYLRSEEPPIDTIFYGQRLKLTGHIWQTDPVTNPYEFDFGKYLSRQGLAAYATARIGDVEILDQRRDLQTAIISARRAISDRIDALFPDNAGLMRALVLGDRSLLSDELRDSLNRTGTGHLISISGLHVTVLSSLLAMLLKRFMSRRRANALAVLLLIPYGMLIGFGAPFIRALVMFALLCFAPVAGLPSDPITRLSAVLLGYALVDPLIVGDAGFVLSFSASAGILLLMPPLSALFGIDMHNRPKPAVTFSRRMIAGAKNYILALLCVSLAAQLATLPAVISFFGVQSVISLPFNMICVPLCMLGYVTGLIVLILSAVSLPLAITLARLPDSLFTLLTGITRLGTELPVASVRFGRYPLMLTLLHCAIILTTSELSRIRPSIRRFMPFSLLAVAVLASLVTYARAWNFSIVFLDAGQADCAVVRTRGHTYMIDTGDTYTPAADYLSATCLHLDGVLLTHPHQDHAGGLSDILAEFRPDAIYIPEGWFKAEGVSSAVVEGMDAALNMGVNIVELAAGDIVELSSVACLEVFSPASGELPAEINDMSLLTLIACEGHTALFTGDLSQQGEPAFIPDAEVLKVAHHGSAKATSDRFLNACTPDIAVISVGENNFGHPAEETMDRLSGIGAEVYLTRDCGAVTLSITGGEWRVDTYLEAQDELE